MVKKNLNYMKKLLSIALALITTVMFGGIIANAVPTEYAGTAFILATLLTAGFAFFVGLPKGVLANTPAATAGDYSAAYISLQDIGMPKWYSRLVARFGDQGAEVVGMVQAMGWTDKSAQKLIQHYEDDWIWDSFKVMSNAGGGATATLTIDPQSIYAGRFFPVVTDIIEFPNKDASGNNIQAQVTAVGANTISLKVAKAAWTIPAVVDGQELIVVTGASAEGTGQPTPRRTTYNLYQNTFATVKESVEMTGDAMTEQLKWEQYTLISGKTVTGIVSQTSMELDLKQMIKEQGMFLSGNKYEDLTQDGKTVPGTEGMFPALNRAAIPYGYTIFGMSTYDTIEKSLSRVYAGQISGMLNGIDVDITSENVLADYLKHTNVDYVTKNANSQLFGDNEGAAVAVRFRYIEKAKRVFAMKRFEALQNPKQYGATDYDYTGRFVIMPLKKNNVDPQTKAKVPTMRTLYRSLDGYDRQKEMFTTGSANAAKYGNTNDVDNRLLHCRTQMGAEFFAINQWVNGYRS
jgi:hypothetical protein